MTIPIVGLNGNTLECECGHTETVEITGEYKVIPTGRYRWRMNPETSEVWIEDEHRYICDNCWEALPEE